jgi:hypothetical protein
VTSQTIDKIRSRGYWDVTVHPTRRLENPLPASTLLDTLRRNAVSMRGWPVPFIDYRRDVLSTQASVGQDIDATMVDQYESWRFTTQGQFSQLRAISADWRGGQERTPVPIGSTSVIEVWEILFYITELVELAARLALVIKAREFRLASELHHMAGRQLVAGVSGRHLSDSYVSGGEIIGDDRTVPVESLTASPRGIAVEISASLFAGFGWHANAEVLRDFQRELTER